MPLQDAHWAAFDILINLSVNLLRREKFLRSHSLVYTNRQLYYSGL